MIAEPTTTPVLITSHEAHSLHQSIQNAGKKEWSRRSQQIAFRMFADEQLIRRGVEIMKSLGATEEQLKPFVARVAKNENG